MKSSATRVSASSSTRAKSTPTASRRVLKVSARAVPADAAALAVSAANRWRGRADLKSFSYGPQGFRRSAGVARVQAPVAAAVRAAAASRTFLGRYVSAVSVLPALSLQVVAVRAAALAARSSSRKISVPASSAGSPSP